MSKIVDKAASFPLKFIVSLHRALKLSFWTLLSDTRHCEKGSISVLGLGRFYMEHYSNIISFHRRLKILLLH